MGNRKSTFIHCKRCKFSSNSKKVFDDIVIIWLNDHPDSKLSKCGFVNSIRMFSNVARCEEYLTNEINDKQKIFFILSDFFAEEILPRIDQLSSIESIYLFSPEKNRSNLLSTQYSKLNVHIFSKLSELNEKLQEDLDHCQNDLIRIDLTNHQLNKLEPDFMYSQLLKETLLNIDYDQTSKSELIDYCLEQSTDELNIIQEFENNYEKHSPIWWYTRECFVYEMINKALRTENIEILIKMGFFIRDLHRQIQSLYSTQQEHSSMVVYRGQGMTNHQFAKLCEYKGGLISFQNFLSTSLEKHVSLQFARRALEKPGLRGIVFRMKIDPTLINSSNPYASLNQLSYFQNREKEILFSTHTVFRIEDIRPMKDEHKIWQVNLRLTTNEDDVQLQQLTKHLRQDLQSSSNPWESLAKLLLTMGQFDKSEQIYENILMKTSPNDREQLAYIYHQLGCVENEKNHLDQSLDYFQHSLNIKGNYLPEKYDDPQLADTYSNIGSIYHTQGKLDQALEYFNHALQTNTNDQRILASIYNNIGMVYKRKDLFTNALQYFEKSLQIDLDSLPPTHPDLATTYSNIGRVYFALKDYSNARFYYQKTLDIRRLSLPQNHPLLLLALEDYQTTAMILRKPIVSSPIPLRTYSSLHSKLSQHSRKLIDQVSNHIK